jgi:hypothetical protein
MTHHDVLCILFFFHNTDALTKFHLASLRQSNPSAVIVPVTDSVHELLPGSIDVAHFPSPWADAHKWRSIDTALYRWFENRTFNARHYLIVEYDCLCTVDLKDYYAEVMNADVAGVDFFRIKDNPRWKWFMQSELNNIPEVDRKYAAGVVPLTCMLFSHEALEKIVANVYRQDIFCELRLGTIINKLGLNFERLPARKRNTICWHTYPWQANRPGLFHGIKSTDHNAKKHRQPGVICSRLYDSLRSANYDRELLPFYLQGKRHGLRRLLGLP